MQGIYRILNLITGMWYVGSAQNIKARWKEHKRNLRKRRDSVYLQNAFNKYGVDNFILEILEEVRGCRGEAYGREQDYLDLWWHTGCLYNVGKEAVGFSSGEAHPFHGSRRSEEWKRKQSRLVIAWHRTHDHPNAISYPAFFNDITRERILAGSNLWRMCEKYDLSYDNMYNLTNENTKQTQDGWRLEHTNPDEVTSYYYPAFYNDYTEKLILEGYGLRKLCEEQTLVYHRMRGLVDGFSKRTKDGWRLTSTRLEEIRDGKVYPAFINSLTGEIILAGRNLRTACKEHNLPYGSMCDVKHGRTKQSRDGWRLATESEIASRSILP